MLPEQELENAYSEYQQLLMVACKSENSLQQRLYALGALGVHLDQLYSVRLTQWRVADETRDAVTPHFLQTMSDQVVPLLTAAETLLHHELFSALATDRHRMLVLSQVSLAQRAWLRNYFVHHVYPLLTPLAVDPGHPFPFISSGSMNLAVELQKPDWWSGVTAPLFARVKVPQLIPRLIEVIPSVESSIRTFVLSEELIRHFINQLFPNMPIRGVYCFRVLRATRQPNVALPLADHRYSGEVVRLDVEKGMSAAVLSWLTHYLRVPSSCIFHCQPPLDLSYLATVQIEGQIRA